MILFIDACVRQNSRTRRLANALLSALGGEAEQLRLVNVRFEAVNEAFLNKRDALIAATAFDDGMFTLARQFAAADIIDIAAPHWDLSFPAALKQYVEQINVRGITF
ncbi:MAG: NAD(P)H-dependent oxidoreductase, partial [Pyramidobacter sp.]|nr:NAD(P)H-dependent oxidoreductase [Pyramidobacter sp.]